jgi:hypothetical protein
MSVIAFETLKLAQRLEAAGLPTKQAQDVATAISDTIGEAVVTREYLDLRLAELRAAMETRFAEGDTRLAEVKADLLKWMFGAAGLQTLTILGGMAALLRLLG